MSLRIAVLVAGVAALALLLVVVGRWEARRHADDENAGMARVLTQIGPLDSPQLSGYRRMTIFDCLTYRRDANVFALELCADARGRVIEAFDRRHGEPEIWSLREDPGRATQLVDRRTVDRLLRRMKAPSSPVG